MKQLQGKTALITGGSRGIGQAIVSKFAAEGANIVFTYQSSEERGHMLAAELQSLGIQVIAYQSDAADFEAASTLVKKVIQKFGRLDILVNNAGIIRDQRLICMREQDWDEVICVNLKSVFNTVQAATTVFSDQRSGSIINISSVVGLRGNATQANYAASKAGIIGFTKAVALELGSKNVRSNAIAPGLIATDMTRGLTDATIQSWRKRIPLQRIGLPEDVADSALFLASDASSYITGQVLQVDGGMYT